VAYSSLGIFANITPTLSYKGRGSSQLVLSTLSNLKDIYSPLLWCNLVVVHFYCWDCIE